MNLKNKSRCTSTTLARQPKKKQPKSLQKRVSKARRKIFRIVFRAIEILRKPISLLWKIVTAIATIGGFLYFVRDMVGL